ncbi:HPP family protein [Sphaerotilaceae bacterium SBD11-9]
MSLPNPTPAATPALVHARAWLRGFIPARMRVNTRERLRVVCGAAIGLLVSGLLGWFFAEHAGHAPWLIAPIGASAVLVYGLPASPLAQPWSVVGGNTVSALVGMACVAAWGTSPWVAGVAVGLAIGAMFALRCLHPPGGASALLVVLSGVHDPSFALMPVLTNSLLLVLVGVAYNNATGRRYPHGQLPAPAAQQKAPGFSEADLDAVLARYNQVLDVSRDDLQQLLSQAELQAYQRRLGETRCADIMSRDLATVEYGTSLQDAWALLRERRIKALPVIDKVRRVVGIVTLADFMRHADLDFHHGWADRLRALIRASYTTHSDKPEAVGQIMVRQVRVASADRPLSELVPLFADTGHHHIPIIDAEKRLVGIITQSDLVAALCRTG